MNKSIDIFWLQIEGKCPSVKFKHINYDTGALSWIVPSASLASAIEEIKMKTSLSPLLCLIISPGFHLRYENVSLWLWTSRKCAILSINYMNIQAQISATAHFLYWKWRRFYQEGWHWWWWVVMGGVWSDLVDIGRAMGVGLSGAGSLIYMLRISDWWCIWNLIIIYLSPISIWAINIIIEVSESSLKVQKKYCYVSVCISFWVSNF